MGKSTAHYRLAQVRALVEARRVRMTDPARSGAALLGLTRREMLEVVLGLGAEDFYKSMTTYADHRIWQDVYHPMTAYGGAYLKLTILDDLLIVSFKAR